MNNEAEIIQKAYEVGRDLDKAYGSCGRCVVAALQETAEILLRQFSGGQELRSDVGA